MARISVVLLSLLITCGCKKKISEKPSKSIRVAELLSLKPNQLDTIGLNNYSAEDFIFLAGAVTLLNNDPKNDKRNVGEIWFSLIAEHLSRNIDSSTFSEAPESRDYLILVLQKNGYHIPPTPPTDFKKFLHYLKNGEFGHIWSRIKSRNYHYLIIALILFSVIFRMAYKKFRKNG